MLRHSLANRGLKLDEASQFINGELWTAWSTPGGIVLAGPAAPIYLASDVRLMIDPSSLFYHHSWAQGTLLESANPPMVSQLAFTIVNFVRFALGGIAATHVGGLAGRHRLYVEWDLPHAGWMTGMAAPLGVVLANSESVAFLVKRVRVQEAATTTFQVHNWIMDELDWPEACNMTLPQGDAGLPSTNIAEWPAACS